MIDFETVNPKVVPPGMREPSAETRAIRDAMLPVLQKGQAIRLTAVFDSAEAARKAVANIRRRLGKTIATKSRVAQDSDGWRAYILPK